METGWIKTKLLVEMEIEHQFPVTKDRNPAFECVKHCLDFPAFKEVKLINVGQQCSKCHDFILQSALAEHEHDCLDDRRFD